MSVDDLDRAAAYVSKVADEADVYLGVGLQDEDLGASRRGGSEHVRALLGFWADVDVAGPAHAQKNLPEDRDEALRILADFPLPPEAVIDSGHGFHVHWPFDRPWILPDEDERRRAATEAARFQRTLSAHFAKHGRAFDETGDLARVLRIPGTLNHKVAGDARPVRLLEADGSRRYSREAIRAVLVAEPTKPPTGLVVPRLAVVTGRGHPYAQAILHETVERVRTAPRGTRHTALNRAAYALGGYLDTGGLDGQQVREALAGAAITSGLAQDEDVYRTIDDGLAAGRDHPRLLPSGPPVGPLPMVDHFSRLQPGGAFLYDVEIDTDAAIVGDGDQVLHVAGETTLVVGRPGTAKSTLLQQYALRRIGLSVETLLGLSVRPLPHGEAMLYLAADRPKQIRRSMVRMFHDADRPELDQRLWVYEGPPPFFLNKNPERLLAFVEEIEARIERRIGEIVFDSLKDLAYDLAADEGGARVASAFNQVIASGRDLIGAHHQRKAEKGSRKPGTIDDVYGSQWLTAAVGSVVYLHGDPGAHVLELLHLKQPWEPVGPLELTHDHATGNLELRRSPDARRLLETVPDGLTARALCALLWNDQEPAPNLRERARRELEKLVDDGFATRGESAKGRAVRYFPVRQSGHDDSAGRRAET